MLLNASQHHLSRTQLLFTFYLLLGFDNSILSFMRPVLLGICDESNIFVRKSRFIRSLVFYSTFCCLMHHVRRSQAFLLSSAHYPFALLAMFSLLPFLPSSSLLFLLQQPLLCPLSLFFVCFHSYRLLCLPPFPLLIFVCFLLPLALFHCPPLQRLFLLLLRPRPSALPVRGRGRVCRSRPGGARRGPGERTQGRLATPGR